MNSFKVAYKSLNVSAEAFRNPMVVNTVTQIYDHGMSQTTPSVLLEPGLDEAVDLISKILDIGPWIVRSIAWWFE